MHPVRNIAARSICVCICVLALAAVGSRLGAQQRAPTVMEVGAGSEFENYLRALQVAGVAPLHPWSIRAFGPRELDALMAADTTGPWQLGIRTRSGSVAVAPLSLELSFNSAYPYGSNDGPVWQGKGITGWVSSGLGLRGGPFSLALTPVAFRAANDEFTLLDNKRDGRLAFNDGIYPDAVDRPQRFGSSPYGRVDPGLSFLRVDLGFVSGGISTANQALGPATQFSFVLGNNAPGFPHVFLGTARPVNLGVLRVHTRFTWGVLEQSDFSPVQGSPHYLSAAEPGTRRLAAAGTLVLLPRPTPGLEVGISRFFHAPYPSGGLTSEFITLPLRFSFLKDELARGDTIDHNQLMSLFFRWAFPRSGFEVYAERGFEDVYHDLRDVLLDPDHERAYVLGFQKTFSATGRLDVVRGELINYQLPAIARDRHEGQIYLHGIFRQGHTHRGQLLGADAGVGAAAASVLSWTRYTRRGRTAVSWTRTLRAESGDYPATGIISDRRSDVLHSLAVERSRHGARFDLLWGAAAAHNLNRNFSEDVLNLNTRLGIRWHP